MRHLFHLISNSIPYHRFLLFSVLLLSRVLVILSYFQDFLATYIYSFICMKLMKMRGFKSTIYGSSTSKKTLDKYKVPSDWLNWYSANPSASILELNGAINLRHSIQVNDHAVSHNPRYLLMHLKMRYHLCKCYRKLLKDNLLLLSCVLDTIPMTIMKAQKYEGDLPNREN